MDRTGVSVYIKLVRDNCAKFAELAFQFLCCRVVKYTLCLC